MRISARDLNGRAWSVLDAGQGGHARDGRGPLIPPFLIRRRTGTARLITAPAHSFESDHAYHLVISGAKGRDPRRYRRSGIGYARKASGYRDG